MVFPGWLHSWLRVRSPEDTRGLQDSGGPDCAGVFILLAWTRADAVGRRRTTPSRIQRQPTRLFVEMHPASSCSACLSTHALSGNCCSFTCPTAGVCLSLNGVCRRVAAGCVGTVEDGEGEIHDLALQLPALLLARLLFQLPLLLQGDVALFSASVDLVRVGTHFARIRFENARRKSELPLVELGLRDHCLDRLSDGEELLHKGRVYEKARNL